MPANKSVKFTPAISGFNLLQKGALLVGFLLVFELLFIGVLTWLLQQAEHDIYKEWHSKKISTKINDLNRSIITAGSYVFLYGAFKDQTTKERFNHELQNIPQELSSLQKLYAETPERNIDTSALNGSISKLLTVLNKLMKSVDGNFSDLQFLDSADVNLSTKALIDKVRSDLELLDKQEQQFLTGESESRSRHRVQQCLQVGVALNILIAGLMVFLFMKNITSRLSVLTDNAFRISHRQSLNERITGADEIAQLDGSIHKMASDLEAVDRLKAEFLAMITHDLRSPLSAVVGNLQLVLAGMVGEVPEKVNTTIQRSERSCKRLLQLINDLLDIEKLESGKFELSLGNVRAESVIISSVESLQGLAESTGIKLTSETTDALIYADGDRLVQVLINLISNAIKFSPQDAVVTVSAKDAGRAVEFRVTDQGRGIPKSHLKKIFDRFEQVEINDAKLKGGSGLGLAICKAIVEEHHGEIGVESEEGKGSTFWFRIPLASSPQVVS